MNLYIRLKQINKTYARCKTSLRIKDLHKNMLINTEA